MPRDDDESPATTDTAGAEPEPAPDSEPAPEAIKTADAPPLTRAGNPRGRGHWVRGLALTLVGALVPFLIMASDRQYGFSVPVGLLGCLIAAAGLFELLATFDDPDANVVERTSLGKLWPRLVELLAAVIVHVVTLRLAVAGVLPKPIPTAALLITGSFLWVIVATFRVGQALGAWRADESGEERPLLRRHGFWLLVILTLLYLPLLGSFSLSDPWETHYGEVSREMLARDDWISTWWAQDGWFWSKPVFDFWIQALSFKLLGVHFMPGQMLAGAKQGLFPQPEWAARMPIFIITLIGVYAIYKAVAGSFGRRAGFIGAVVLVTMPYFYLIGHQTMTDMPYVGPLTAALGLLLLGFHADPEREVKRVELRLGKRTLRLSAFHLLFAFVILTVLPQVLYLASRNLTLQLSHAPFGFRPHIDEFFAGSGGGNCGLPGNQECRRFLPVNKGFEPWLGALCWSVAAGVLLWANRGERRVQRLYFLAGWYFTALAALGKGAPGLVLPIFIALAYVGARKRWLDLSRMELAGLVLVFAAVVLPWYVQMYMRHGGPFTDRLLTHDMYKRAFVHVHDTNTGDDTSFRYYVWQLGYGLFPWTGLGAAGLLWASRIREKSQRGDATALLLLWFVATFGMFTVTLTKFHHYIFPLVPPIAMFAGVVLDRCIRPAELPRGKRLAAYLGGLGIGALVLLYGASRLVPGSLLGVTNAENQAPPGNFRAGLALAALGLAAMLAAAWAYRGRDAQALPDAGRDAESSHDTSVMLAIIGLASAVPVALAGRDLFMTTRGDIEGQARLMHLFTYNYRREWPASLDFKSALLAFTLAATLGAALLVARRLRTHAAVGLLVLGVLWGAWGLDVYLFQAGEHWGQRSTMLAYYRDRQGPEQPLVAYQMNWKGENFYMGNQVPAFVSSGQRFKDWVKKEREKGAKVMYFTTEHGRINGLKSELGNPANFKVLTDKRQNNKFFVARVEW
ncbi:MAG: glycosyltransferase family 39 protein [Sorangiineae bacterium]|nr:glycosyltransferase family 39 protein [Polyangiaceae bacterium]MEB2324354.1 glycosyltransferase family 39 protein [Sorangiineae bacterium]